MVKSGREYTDDAAAVGPLAVGRCGGGAAGEGWAPAQYGVKRSPTLILSGKHYHGPIERDAIKREVILKLLKRSF